MAEGLLVEQLITCCNIIFAQYELSGKIISAEESNFVSDKCKIFCIGCTVAVQKEDCEP